LSGMARRSVRLAGGLALQGTEIGAAGHTIFGAADRPRRSCFGFFSAVPVNWLTGRFWPSDVSGRTHVVALVNEHRAFDCSRSRADQRQSLHPAERLPPQIMGEHSFPKGLKRFELLQRP
jgi:hypothetical protein